MEVRVANADVLSPGTKLLLVPQTKGIFRDSRLYTLTATPAIEIPKIFLHALIYILHSNRFKRSEIQRITAVGNVRKYHL